MSGQRVTVGSVVCIRIDSGAPEWLPVSATDAPSSVSARSPIGLAIMDKEPGLVTTVETPGGSRQIAILDVCQMEDAIDE